ncbi:MAG: hypothetical protein HY895_07300 [Deltaproteobacteria bacterium]|nr:hypothetical protein [Deltaproteobacteria bacterium]
MLLEAILKISGSQPRARRTPLKKRNPQQGGEHFSEARNAAIDRQMHF